MPEPEEDYATVVLVVNGTKLQMGKIPIKYMGELREFLAELRDKAKEG
jgi:hypothetical protein